MSPESLELFRSIRRILRTSKNEILGHRSLSDDLTAQEVDAAKDLMLPHSTRV